MYGSGTPSSAAHRRYNNTYYCNLQPTLINAADNVQTTDIYPVAGCCRAILATGI